MKIIIMAGGGGTRLWPLSRLNKPKQFSRIIGDKTMFEETINRFLPEYAWQNIYVCLGERLAEEAKALVPEIPSENYIIEPSKRDTAPAMALAAANLFFKFPDEPIAFVPSDHFISDSANFLKTINLADEIIRRTGKMVDIAITPSFPSTALGYTKIGPLVEDNGVAVYQFAGHTEKPKFEIARQYLEEGNYLWHASYYMWTPRKILEAFEKYSPTHSVLIKQILESINDKYQVAESFKQMEKISFDYAITEKMNHEEALIIKGDFGWSDVGAFDVLYDAQRKKVDSNNNLVTGKWVGEDTQDCLIYGGRDRIIATVGLSDLVIVDTGDVILICPKAKAQDVKKIVTKLQGTDRESYL